MTRVAAFSNLAPELQSEILDKHFDSTLMPPAGTTGTCLEIIPLETHALIV